MTLKIKYPKPILILAILTSQYYFNVRGKIISNFLDTNIQKFCCLQIEKDLTYFLTQILDDLIIDIEKSSKFHIFPCKLHANYLSDVGILY